VGAFVLDLVPGGWLTIAGSWAVSVVPVFVLIRNIATGRYPNAAVRLLMFRVFWYAQLLLLALAFASAAGFVLGLPFRVPVAAGRRTSPSSPPRSAISPRRSASMRSRATTTSTRGGAPCAAGSRRWA